MPKQDTDHPVLPLGLYQLEFNGPVEILPEYPGSAWRGSFGRALKKTVCVTRERDCSNCPLHAKCIYSYIFETPPPAQTDRMRKYTTVPHPFVLRFGKAQSRQPDSFQFGMNLFGRANEYLPFIIYAWHKAGEQGITRGRAPFALQSVRQYDLGSKQWREIFSPDDSLNSLPPAVCQAPPAPAEAEIEFYTPLRFQSNRQFVNETRFAPRDFAMNLVRRIAMLTYFHGDQPLEADFTQLKKKSEKLTLLKNNLRWKDWTRYSSRQKQKMQMGGVTGKITLRLEDETLWPFLWLGQHTHAGKATSMGLGEYEIIPLA